MANGALPDDIMFCILSRLPVKCLLRFKSVCRSWRKLFATPEFIKLHLEQFSSDPENEAFIIYDLSKPIMSLSSIEPNVGKPTVLDLPVRANFCQGAYYVGSCNGLVCICFPQFDFSHVIAFWNPTLRLSKFVQLPKENDRNTSFGFGYDAKEDHYIVVQIIYSYRNFGRIEGVEVYYAQFVSSETVKVGFDCSLQSEWGVTVNRNPYWVAKVDQNVCLVYCDVTNLEFKMLPLPAPIVDAKYVVAFVEWKGSLAALMPPKHRGRTSIDVWIFDDFDMIWRKNHTFRPSVVLPNMSVYRCFQYSKNRKILFESHRYKKLYVLDAGTGWVEEIETVHPYHNVCGYSESLAYIEGMENDPVVAPARGSQFSARRFAGVISNLLRKADSQKKLESSRRNEKQATTKEKSKEPNVATRVDFFLPDDIMLCILIRLPVKSLLCFKSVCKAWRKLCATAKFMKMHGHQLSFDLKNENFMVYNLSATMSFLNVGSNIKKPMNLDLPCTASFYPHANYVGCCNGLVCFGFTPYKMDKAIVLWNPALRLSKCIPLPKVDFNLDLFGFGYDAERDDFKVFRMALEHGNTRVEVYSSTSDSWNTIKVGFNWRTMFYCSITVNGNPYWVGYVSADMCLMWCDVTKMEFKTVVLPALIEKHVLARLPFVDWKGSLAALVVSKNSLQPSIDVWVFDDREMIWRLNHTFFPPEELNVGRCFQCLKDGKIIVRSVEQKNYVFDPETGWVREIENEEWRHCYTIYAYNKSLAYIEGMRHECHPITSPAQRWRFAAHRFPRVMMMICCLFVVVFTMICCYEERRTITEIFEAFQTHGIVFSMIRRFIY